MDLRIGGGVSDTSRFAEVFPGSGIYVPKVIGIYGANASGKTNMLFALEFLFKMAVSFEEPRPVCFPFNSSEGFDSPTRLAIEFGGNKNPVQPERTEFATFRYELKIHALAKAGLTILSESLRYKPGGQGKWQRVFERDSSGNVKGSDLFPIRGFSHLVKTLRPNATVIASFAYFKHPTATAFNDAAKRAVFLTTILGRSEEPLVHKILSSSPDSLLKLNDQLTRIDIGIEQLRYVDTPEGPEARFKHSGLSQEMKWMLESHGTRSFIRIFPIIESGLRQGSICAINELDSAIHPLLLSEILRWFQDSATSNPLNTQLWFTCQSPTLLQDLHKEEVVLCEKDRQGQTSIYSLMDVKVRRDDNIFRKYMSGAYGGVPLLG